MGIQQPVIFESQPTGFQSPCTSTFLDHPRDTCEPLGSSKRGRLMTSIHLRLSMYAYMRLSPPPELRLVGEAIYLPVQDSQPSDSHRSTANRSSGQEHCCSMTTPSSI